MFIFFGNGYEKETGWGIIKREIINTTYKTLCKIYNIVCNKAYYFLNISSSRRLPYMSIHSSNLDIVRHMM